MGKTLTGFLLLFLRPVKTSICQSIVLARSSLIMFSRPLSLCLSHSPWKQLRNQVSCMLNLCTLCKLELISRKLDFKTNASLVPLFFPCYSLFTFLFVHLSHLSHISLSGEHDRLHTIICFGNLAAEKSITLLSK